MTPEAFVSAVASLGYDAIDLVGPEHDALVKDHGLEIAAVQGHALKPEGLNRLENRGSIEKELEASLARAVQWQIPYLICFSGNRAGLSDEQGIENTAANLSYFARMAEDAGVTLIVELLNSKVDHPDYQCDRTAWGVEVCRQVESPRVQLLYDIYHMQIMEGDVIRTIRENHRYFGHYHTAGNPGRNEIDDSQELNYRAIVRAMREIGFDGYLAQEFIPLGDPLAGLKNALEICKS
ncbi:MAG: TIM barrel protein [Chloroflexi bacterium]|nr:TIM barrel protein [Chloroflexota bacterium]